VVERAVVAIEIKVGERDVNVAVAHRSIIVTVNTLESLVTAEPVLTFMS